MRKSEREENKKEIIVFGAGQRGVGYSKRLCNEKIPILFICDNDKNKIGTEIEGIPVKNPKEILAHKDTPVFIATQKCDDIKKQLVEMGVSKFYEFDEDFYSNYFVSYLTSDYLNEKSIYGLENNNKENNMLVSVVLIDGDFNKSSAAMLSVKRYMNHLQTEIVPFIGSETKVNGEYILILNSNDWIQANAVDALVDILDRNDGECIVGSKLVSKRGSIYSAGKVLHEGNWVNLLYGRDFLDSMANYVRETDALEMSGVMMRREYWDLWKGLDVTDRENNFWMELKKRGISVIYQPKSVLVTDRLVEEETDSDLVHSSIFSQGNYKYRGNMLLEDNAVARYDQNTGARCVAQYIDIFKALNMRIVYMPMNFEYDMKYVETFQQMGLCVIYGAYYKENYKKFLEEISGQLDYAFLNRPEQSSMVIDSIRKNPHTIVSYFGHDIHHLRLLREYEVTHDEAIKSKAIAMEMLEYDIIDKADYAGYPSRAEVDYLRKRHKNVEYYPLYYFYEKERIMLSSDRKGIIFVGGFKHRPNVDGIIWFFQMVYPILNKKGFNEPIYIVGSNPPDVFLKLENSNVKVTGYISDDDLQRMMSECRLAFVPLRFGAGMKGKVLEAMYAGVPVITTAIGAEGIDVEESGITVADDAEDFADKIIKLYGDFEVLKIKSVMEQSYIQKHFGEQQLMELFLKQIEGRAIV